tara:strand:+ start:125 stop:574 length:450 start_codon:yes stop_codon:yes gene_type:complete
VYKLLISFLLIFFDLATKFLIKKNLELNQRVELTNFIDLIYVQNYGVSFGLLSGFVSHWILVFVGFMIVLLIMYLTKVSNKNLEKLAYFIIIVGAIANILDRVINTFVVDFLLIHYKNFYWPAFNLADIYITIGIIMLLISFFIKSEKI